MTPKKFNIGFILVAGLLGILVISGCSTKKNTWSRRAYHSVTCKYNVYWNGGNSLNEGYKNLQENVTENYNKVLRVYNYGTKPDAQKTYPKMDRTIKKTADLLRIEQLLDRKPGQLSGGQRQRVALGRAIVRDPQVFLFDEPLSNLDAKLRIAMRAELVELHQRLKTTIIYVTHDQLEAMTMGSRIVVMKDGLIQQVDTPDTVYDHPVNKFVAGFIGSPSMNFINCTIARQDGDLVAKTGGLNLKIPDQFAKKAETYVDDQVTLGIRPEHLTDSASIQTPDPESSFRALVRVIESAGSEKLVHIRNEDDTMVARLDPHVKLGIGDAIDFTARMESAHLFDINTGDTIF